MLKKIVIILILVFNLLPVLQKSNNIYAQMGEEDDYTYDYHPNEPDFSAWANQIEWQHIHEVYNEVQDRLAEEHREWIAEMNQEVQNNLNEIEEILRDFFEEWWAELRENALQNPTDYIQDPNTPSNPPPPTPDCYIYKKDNSDKKYRTGSQMFVVAKPNQNDTLYVMDQNKVIKFDGFRWQKDGIFGSNIMRCIIPTNTPGTYTITVKDTLNNKLVEIKLYVSGKSVIKFSKKNNYDGQYGFDSEGYQYEKTKNDYKKLTIDNKPYQVPWMSMFDGQTDTIKVDPMLTPTDAASSTYWIQFRRTSNKIRINDDTTLKVIGGSAINALKNIRIKCNEFDTSSIVKYKREAIYVLNNVGDTLGKIEISCQNPIKKKLVIVYVKTDSLGYPARRNYLKYLNDSSHNQIFKKWDLKTTYSDSINLTTEYAANPSSFKQNIHAVLSNYYGNVTGFILINTIETLILPMTMYLEITPTLVVLPLYTLQI